MVVLLWSWLTAQLDAGRKAPCCLWRSCPSQPDQPLFFTLWGATWDLCASVLESMPPHLCSHWCSLRPVKWIAYEDQSTHVNNLFSIKTPEIRAPHWRQIPSFHVWCTLNLISKPCKCVCINCIAHVCVVKSRAKDLILLLGWLRVGLTALIYKRGNSTGAWIIVSGRSVNVYYTLKCLQFNNIKTRKLQHTYSFISRLRSSHIIFYGLLYIYVII